MSHGRFYQIAAPLLAGAFLCAAGDASAQNAALKTIQGKVLAANHAPLAGAIVYLQDAKTQSIKSFISTADGSFRFGQTPSTIDYALWASWKGKSSARKTVPSSNPRKTFTATLIIK